MTPPAPPPLKRPHISVALILAPIGGSFLVLMGFVALVAAFERSLPDAEMLMQAWLILGAPTLLATCTFGLAWHAFAVRRKLTRFSVYFLAGGAMGALLPVAILLAWPRGPYGGGALLYPLTMLAIVGGVTGAATSGLLWWIRRPDRAPIKQDVAGVFE